MSRALDALHDTILYSWVSSRPKVPGAIVTKMSQRIRDDLKELTMEDIKNVRHDLACFIEDKEAYQRYQRRRCVY